jgi:hypothetical protein
MMADTTAETNTAQPPAAKKAPLKKTVRKPGSKNLPAQKPKQSKSTPN